MNILNVFKVILTLSCISFATACKKMVEIDPPTTSLASDVVYRANETAISAITGAYTRMCINDVASQAGLTSTSVLLGLAADELVCFTEDATLRPYYMNNMTSIPELGVDYWRSIYTPYIFLANVAIGKLQGAITYEQDNNASLLNDNVRKQLLGEMQFFRALCYFYLVQLYGDVPLILTADYVANSTTGRTAKALVYEQMIKDLKNAQTNLNAQFVERDVVTTKAGSPRIRPTKAAATALLARVYLYTKSYQAAEQQALSLIENTSLFKLVGVDDIEKANNTEAIWQLQPVNTGRNTEEGWMFILPESGPGPFNPVYLNGRLLSLFEPGDARRSSWIKSVVANGVTYYHPYKYKQTTGAVTEYTTVLRLAEQFLICAEARARLGNVSGADDILNVLRKRALLGEVHSLDQQDAIKNVMKERRVELIAEWGHRWLDLKRTGEIDEVMEKETPLKGGGSWRSYQQLFPVPVSDMQTNSALSGQQNPGYQ